MSDAIINVLKESNQRSYLCIFKVLDLVLKAMVKIVLNFMRNTIFFQFSVGFPSSNPEVERIVCYSVSGNVVRGKPLLLLQSICDKRRFEVAIIHDVSAGFKFPPFLLFSIFRPNNKTRVQRVVTHELRS